MHGEYKETDMLSGITYQELTPKKKKKKNTIPKRNQQKGLGPKCPEN